MPLPRPTLPSAPVKVTLRSAALLAALMLGLAQAQELPDFAKPTVDAGQQLIHLDAAQFGEVPAGTLLDGSFEFGTPSAFWNEFSVLFGTPICNIGVCGTGNGTSRPRSGDFWAWFGGAAGLQDFSFVSQDIVLPPGEARLAFYLWNGSVDAGGSDSFEVGVDDDVLFSIVEGDTQFTAGYQRVEVDLADYADGLTHTLFFRATDFAGDNTSFALDDISLNGQSVGPNLLVIPTLSQWGLLLMALLVAMLGAWRVRHSVGRPPFH